MMQVMTCHLFGANPFDPILAYFNWIIETNFSEILIKDKLICIQQYE